MSELKIGMIGLDTSHCPAFANLLNNSDDPFHVEGGRVVVGFPGGSPGFAPSADRVEKFTQRLQDEFGLEMVDSIEAVAEQSDAILLESVDGRQHLEQFQKLAPFGKPVFIDKPFTTSKADAEKIFELSEKHGSPVYSCSSIRYAGGLFELGGEKEVLGCETFGPNAIHDDFPGVFWYGIHSAEVLFSKMGTGCRTVQVQSTDRADAIVGVWDDGRVGTLYGYRFQGVGNFGATLFTSEGVEQSLAAKEPPYYALLLQRIIPFFQTGKAPIDPQETLEITAFLEAANRSKETGNVVEL